MKRLLILLALPLAALGKPLEVAELASRLEIRGEILFLDETGKRLLGSGTEWRSWRTRGDRIESNWSSQSRDYPPIAFRHSWEILKDGTLKAVIEQFAKVEGEGSPRFKDSVRREEILVENFAPVVWVAHQEKDRRIVARFTPVLRDDEKPVDVAAIPLSGRGMMVTDNKGYLWARNADVTGRYAGLVTHRGALFLSYAPFPGAKALGTASGSTVELDLGGNHTVTFLSTTPFLPEGVHARVYGIFHGDRRTARLDSLHTVTSNREGDFVERMHQTLASGRFR